MKKRLINPTDEVLKEAFAQYVAGWKYIDFPVITAGGSVRGYWVDKHGDTMRTSSLLVNVDALLPYLNPWTWRADGDNFPSYDVKIWEPGTATDVHDPIAEDSAGALARAIVLTLLRAHGVEITFTPNGDETD